MFEKSTSDARPDEVAEHRCVTGTRCRAASLDDDGQKQPAVTAKPQTLCDECTRTVTWAINDLPAMWVALHIAIGDQTRHQAQRVSASRTAPINLNADVDALKVAIVEWLVAAAAPIAEALNVDDPRPRNNTDTEHARIVDACTRIIAPHIDRLIALPADDVTIWLTGAETEYPGERFHVDDNGVPHRGTARRVMTGPDLALKLTHLHGVARSMLAITTPRDKLPLPCPYCNQYELSRSQRTISLVSGKSKDVDQIDCGTCGLSWPYERYQQLCLIWVREDEMEREKLQKQLDEEKQRRELAEWLLAKREWQFSLALDCPDVSASEFAKTVLTDETAPDNDAYLSDKDIAAFVGVADSTVRSWASRGHIDRHIAEDGSTTYLARQVWEYAKSHTGGRAATVRRLTNERKATA